MSLRVWLPLTKDLRQQGLDNVTVTNNGATFNSAGKLGGCYEFASGKRIQTTLPSTSNLNSKAISFACWVNISSWNSSYDCLMSIADGTSWQQSRATLCRNNTASTLCWNIADGSTSTRVYTTTSLSTNIWYHIACTYDGASLKIYVNGTLNNSAAATLSIGYAGTFNIGGWSGNNYPINCKMNDVRVYSHCLSPMEVKELAKGLVLHYPLNRNGWGQENLLKNSKKFNSGGCASGNTKTIEADGTVKIVAASGNSNYVRFSDCDTALTLNTGDTFTFSIKIKSPDSIKKPTVYFYSGLGYYSMQGTMSSDWTIIYYTGVWSISTFTTNIHLGFGSAPGTYYIESFKLEKGDKITPWCPHSSDALYTTLGLDGITEYDCSGFCNNGTRSGTFTWTSDTPKYGVSTKFNGAEVIVIPFTCGLISEAITVACWGYESNWNVSTAERLLGAATNASGWCIGDYGSENTLFAFYANGGYNVATGFKQLSTGWHHFVITFDGLNLIYYVDGQQFSKKTFSTKQVANGNYNINIGRHYGGGYNFKGNMSDVRIYATALSAEDVLSLYQNSAYIDSSGNIYGTIHEV